MPFSYPNIPPTFTLLLGIILLPACTRVGPDEVVGIWSVDQFVEDGMDKTSQLPARPWGTAVRLAPDGSFRTNGRVNNHGTWKISPQGTLYFRFPQDAEYKPWEVATHGELMVLKATTQQLYLSRTDSLAALPPVTINLKNNLPGIWYFYQMKTDTGLTTYPQSKKHARWLHISKSGTYKSGEGRTPPMGGRWALRNDTLTFSDLNRPWKRSWKVTLDAEGILYFYTLSGDTTGSEQVSFINEVNLPRQ